MFICYPLFSQDSIVFIQSMLVNNGYENVSVRLEDDRYVITVEDNQYRFVADGIHEILNLIRTTTGGIGTTVFFLKNGIPQFQLDFNTNDTTLNKSGNLKYPEDKIWRTMVKNKTRFSNKSFLKSDLVIYPQLYFRNANFDKIYHLQFNIAPALELSLWKGCLMTTQIILPVKNELEVEGDRIRPGFLTLNQQFRLKPNWYFNVIAGNFNQYRYGISAQIRHPFGQSDWTLNLRGDLTGSSYFTETGWQAGKVEILTGEAGVEYYYERFQLQMNLSIASYLNNDMGLRADCTRHFGEKTIGFYFVYGDMPLNGGFNFSVPISSVKRDRKKGIRVRAAKYYALEYNTSTAGNQQQYFDTAPNQNNSESWHHPSFLQFELNQKSIQ